VSDYEAVDEGRACLAGGDLVLAPFEATVLEAAK